MSEDATSLPEDATLQVGPYRLLRRLGEGGMGEVFEAYDPRLDRRVAVKRIHADRLSPEGVERLRREARIGAGLFHSGIVQVFDVSSLEDHEYLVMEYVPGESLRQRVAKRPIPVAAGIDLARDIADALSYAHRNGVIHRDLKTENVLIGEDGRAKIADFGIARQQFSTKRQLEDPTLTASGDTPGTVRSMAPEQALGEGADHRSDFFSFGVLIYEMLSGVSPFRGASDVATLSRLVSKPHPPIRELVPAIPPGLEALIDQLLEKEPELRPRDASELVDRLEALRAEVGTDSEGSVTRVRDVDPRPPSNRRPAALPRPKQADPPAADPGLAVDEPRLPWHKIALVAAIVMALLILGWIAWPSPSITYVAVPTPTVNGSLEDERARLLTHAIRGALQRTLVSLRGLSPKTFDEIDAIEGSPLDIAQAVAADELVLASLDCRRAGCAVVLSRIDGSSGGVLRTASFDVLADDLPLAARAVGHQLREAYPHLDERPGAAKLEVDLRDYKTFLRTYDAFYGAGDVARSQEELLEALRRIHRRSPNFLDAWLLAGEIALDRFSRQRDGRDLDRARAMANRAAELAPDDPAVLLLELRTDFDGGDLERAAATLGRWEERSPGDAHLLARRAQLLEARGDTQAALDLLHRAVEQQPSWKAFFNLALTAQRLGEIATARDALERLLARAPGHYRALSLMAQIELVNGDPKKAADLYRQLVKRSPGVGELSNLGLALTLLSDYPAAAAAYRQVADRAPDNPFFLLNLADAVWLSGESSGAEELYRQVVELLEGDPVATGWQHHSVRAQAQAHLGLSTDAVVSIQQALRLAPDNSHVAFEAALVYTLLADFTSATANAQRALELGFDAGWFRLPWFDPIRDRLAPLMEQLKPRDLGK